jgi:FtsP/CotA-like multicopper oxidase with cupredoxin domain
MAEDVVTGKHLRINNLEGFLPGRRAAVRLHAALRDEGTRPLFSFKEETVKKTVLAVVMAVATGIALSAQAPAPKQTAPKTPSMKSAPTKPRMETAEVVSTDPTAKTITIKDSSGQNQTLTAKGAAVTQLARVKAGDQVRLTVHDNDVTRISKAGAKKGAAKKG